ncbi:hypothetical protein CCHR01_18745 [Colletotrichum chrysophilum]|uniref:Uncharacterized protein n=1 Tax=Colletotrichum chrysophilum TaxID=1836956 RepID=A0AAD9E7W4_9PEZI|nr:hypothetical protein CCHR01_18745 [Colletotrichum chrysophilum]
MSIFGFYDVRLIWLNQALMYITATSMVPVFSEYELVDGRERFTIGCAAQVGQSTAQACRDERETQQKGDRSRASSGNDDKKKGKKIDLPRKLDASDFSHRTTDMTVKFRSPSNDVRPHAYPQAGPRQKGCESRSNAVRSPAHQAAREAASDLTRAVVTYFSSMRIPRGIFLSPFEIPESHKKEKKSIAFLFRI